MCMCFSAGGDRHGRPVGRPRDDSGGELWVPEGRRLTGSVALRPRDDNGGKLIGTAGQAPDVAASCGVRGVSVGFVPSFTKGRCWVY